MPDKIISTLKEDIKHFFHQEEVSLNDFHSKTIQVLDNINTTLFHLTSVDGEIYKVTKDNIEKLIKLYSTHVNNSFSGASEGINKVIKTFSGNLYSEIGVLINDILLSLTSNQFIAELIEPNERTTLIESVKSIQSSIQFQTEALFSRLRLNSENYANHDITHRVDTGLNELIIQKKAILKTTGDALIASLHSKFSGGSIFENLLINYDNLDILEQGIKKIKIEGIKTFFHYPLITNALTKNMHQSLLFMINKELLPVKDTFLKVIRSIQLSYKLKVKNMQDTFYSKTKTLKEQMRVLYSKEQLGKILNYHLTLIASSEALAKTILFKHFSGLNAYLNQVIDAPPVKGRVYYKTIYFIENYNKGRANILKLFDIIISIIETELPKLVNLLQGDIKVILAELNELSQFGFLTDFDEMTFVSDLKTIINTTSNNIMMNLEKNQQDFQIELSKAKESITSYYNIQLSEYDDNFARSNDRFLRRYNCNIYATYFYIPML